MRNIPHKASLVAMRLVSAMPLQVRRRINLLVTRQYRMTLDEAQLILNVKRGAEIQQIWKVTYLFFSSISARTYAFLPEL